MRAFSLIGAIASLTWHSSALPDATPPPAGQDPSDVLIKLQAMSMQALEDAERLTGRQVPSGCSLGTAQIRQDWEHMSVPMRKSYVEAVECLFSSPSKLTQYGWPTQSRYDDFVAVHVNMTTTIHNTGNFLGWHRYFVHAYETVLRDECGYTGYAAYWNWFTHRDDVTKSPVFDGSPTSLGGDGEFFYHNGTPGGVLQIPLPSGQGGGCIKEGPFAGQQVSVGPMLSVFDGFPTVKDLFVPNPHCIRRDLNSYVTANYFTAEAFLNVTLGAASGSVKLFQEELQGGFYPGHLGMHAAGHFVLGGDGTDVFSSPNDPAFFLHHAMVDRMWWIWQALHPTLATTIDGTMTMNNDPPSRNATLIPHGHHHHLNFAAVTSFKLTIYPRGPKTYIFTEDKLEKLFELLNVVDEEKDKPTHMLNVGYYLWNEAFDPTKPVIQWDFTYIGPKRDVTAKLAPLDALGPVNVTEADLPYPGILPATGTGLDDPLCAKGVSHIAGTAGVQEYNITTQRQIFDQFVGKAAAHPGLAGTFVVMESYGVGGVASRDPASSAFPMRDDYLLLQISVNYASLDAAALQWAREAVDLWNQGQPTRRPTTYVNYGLGDESLESIYGYEPWRLEKLLRLKKAYDPNNKFRYYVPLVRGS